MLTFAYSEHLCAACRACALSCGLTILHSDALRVLHFFFSTTLHTVCLHLVYLLFRKVCKRQDRTILAQMSIVWLKEYLPLNTNYQSIYI